MLTQSEKKQLKSLANTLTTRYQVGKKELGPTIVDMFNKALSAHELIKIDVMKSLADSIMEVALDLSTILKADIVDTIGHVIILYRSNKDKPKIKLKK